MMIKKTLAAAAVAAMILLAGCGGGGSTPQTAPSTVTKEEVVSLLLSGIQNSSNLRTADGGGSRAGRRTRANEDVYFDESYGLWVKLAPGLADDYSEPSGELYFEDQALTVDAGHNLIWGSDPNVWPQTGKFDLAFTKGNFAGKRDLYEFSVNENNSGSSHGSGAEPGKGTYSYQGAWNEMGVSHFSERYDALDGSWQTYQYVESDDLSYVLTVTSSLGIKFTLNFAPDRTGAGRIEGPASTLPATLTWDENGDGTITWADGSTSPINIYDIGG